MKYQKYSNPAFDIITLNSDKFKSCYVQIIYQSKVEKGAMSDKSLLADYLTNCSRLYPKRKEILKKTEELYRPSIYAVTNKVGGVLLTSFNLGFINPKYVKESDYVDKLLEFFTNLIKDPLFINNEAEPNNFNIVKNSLKTDLSAIEEFADRISLKNALEKMDEKSLSNVNVLGDLEEIENVTPKVLYNTYDELINKSPFSVYVLGNLEMNKIARKLEKLLDNKIIKTKKYEYYVNNKSVSKVKTIKDTSSFIQSNLVMLFNLDNLTETEKNVSFDLFNYLFGSSPIESKLFTYLRSNNSLTYSVSSNYLKYDKLLMVSLGMKKGNEEKAINLIKKALKEMQKGDFTDEEFNIAKENIMAVLEKNQDDPSIIMRYYTFNHLMDIPLIEERMDILKTITKDDIVKLAKKVKLNTIYILESGK